MSFTREGIVPIVWAKSANNLTNSVFGVRSIKSKFCNNINCWTKDSQPYSNYFLQSGYQNMHPDHIQAHHLEGFCKPCYELRLATREERTRVTATLDNFFCEEVTNA